MNSKKPNLEDDHIYIPDEIKAKILALYDTRIDFIRSRSVSTCFRSLLSLPCNTMFPLKVPPLNPTTQSTSTLLLHRKIVYLLRKCTTTSSSDNSNKYGQDTLLIKAEEKTNENKFALFHLTTGENLSHVILKRINLLDYRVSEIVRSYSLDGPSQCTTFTKIVASSSNLLPGMHIEFLALHNGGNLSWWKLGCKEWCPISTLFSAPYSSQFVDIIRYRGAYLALDLKRRLVRINISSKKFDKDQSDFVSYEVIEPTPVSLDFISGKTSNLSDMRSTLVESGGNLYQVNCAWTKKRTWMRSLKFKIFLLDQKENGRARYWRSVQSLGNKFFFLGRDATFSISSRELGHANGDLIYFEYVVKSYNKRNCV